MFLIYKDIQKGSVAKSYMTKASSYMVKYSWAVPHILGSPSSHTVYDFAIDPI
jgi:hypothetical protein